MGDIIVNESEVLYSGFLRMLQRTFFDPADELHGAWSREQLLEMDDRFTAAVKAAFDLGLESRAAAAATYAMNGKQRAEEIAIELAWRYLRTNMDAGIDVSFVEVLAFARERCSGVTAEQVRVEFKKRFKGRWQSTATSVV